MQKGKILNRFGLALVHLPMLVDAFNSNTSIADDIFADIEAWNNLLYNAGFSRFEFSWNDLEIEFCDYIKELHYYIYTFPEPQKSSQAKYGLVVISRNGENRQARYFTLETSFAFSSDFSKVNNGFALCEAKGTSHSYIEEFKDVPTKDNFISVIINKYYSHLALSFGDTHINKCLFSRQRLSIPKSSLDVSLKPKLVVFTDKAYESICKTSKEASTIMTGGFFLGHVLDNGIWVVMDTVDSGPKTIADKYNWEYDREYVNIEANRKAALYSVHLSFLGLWLFHPNGLQYHSRNSDDANYIFSNMNSYGSISGIVIFDDGLRLRLQHLGAGRYPNSLEKDSGYTDVDFEIGDDMIPEEFFKLNN